MHEIIIDNRHKIDTACQLCFHALDKYNQAVEAFHEKRQSITSASIYSQAEQERQINVASEELNRIAQAQYQEIKQNLDTIHSAVNKMGSLLDIGDELQNALSVVKTLGKSLPSETRWGLVSRFKGQQQALVILKAAYEGAEIDPESYFKDLIFDADAVMTELNELAYQIAVQPGTDALVVTSLGDKLERFADSVGVELSKHFRDIVDPSEAYNRYLRAAAGLGTAD